MDMSATYLFMLYMGPGFALGWLRRRQGHRPADAVLAGLAWPLDILEGWLALLGGALARLSACRRDD